MFLWLLTVLLMAIEVPVQAETLYTKTENGLVSMSRGLTADECEQGRKLALSEKEASHKESEAWWVEALKEQEEECKKQYPCEMIQLEGWPESRPGMITDAECLK